MWSDLLKVVLAVGVYTGAGVLLFFVAYNRHILPLRDCFSRRIMVPFIFFGLLLTGAVAGLRFGFSRWAAVPLVILIGVMIGEARRLSIRHRFRGEPPVEGPADRISWRHPVTTYDLVVNRYEIRLPDWKGPRFRIAHLSDLHVHSGYPREFYFDAMDRVSAQNADACFITGDVLSTRRDLDLVAEVLSRPKTRLGSFASYGNHDIWTAPDELGRLLTDCGIQHVTQAPATLETPGGALLVCGNEDPWTETAWQPPVTSDQRLVVLSHTADNIYDLADAGSTMVFSGHYHGGQIALPFIGSLAVPSRFGRRFDHGHFLMGATHLFVSAGIGTHFPPLRLYCRPEIVVVDLLPAFDLSTPPQAVI